MAFDVDNMVLTAPPTATMEEVEAAIKRAGVGLGWQVRTISPGLLEARLPIRTHLAVTAIRFHTQTFSITYKDSMNLKYNAGNKTSLSNFVSWVQNLQNAILAEVSSIGCNGQGGSARADRGPVVPSQGHR